MSVTHFPMVGRRTYDRYAEGRSNHLLCHVLDNFYHFLPRSGVELCQACDTTAARPKRIHLSSLTFIRSSISVSKVN